ncbi:AraC family transcriptional regulator [Fulvivirgaceae bacterium PWU5]|uniref:AraC family transcriptional regulator n=1 Tax=Dawidia cretensis TaxID=2782350 RepID=A0AAP2GWN9_9BACT|nr:helix-turn-helix domain-containing protein [Dawidia cretensis]MBT1710997.1 AraC family transcriptional regulator [Dawidia cretensis]
MNLTFHWINILILIGAFNALVFCIVLLFQRQHPGAKYLAAFVFVFAYNGFETFNWSSGLENYYRFFNVCAYIVIFAMGPSLYLYIGALLDRERKVSPGVIAWHYSLVIFQFGTRMLYIGYHVLVVNHYITAPVSPGQLATIIWTYSEPLSVAVFVVYLAATGVRFHRYTTDLQPKVRAKQKPLLRWITTLLVCSCVLGVSWTVTVASFYVVASPPDALYYPLELGLVLFSYWIVLHGYHQVKVLPGKQQAIQPTADDAHARHFARLREAMEVEKYYLDPALSLSRVSASTGIPVKTISAVLNQHRNMGFADFVNMYRVREVSERMLDPANRQFTLSSLALDSGFNSQATFQRVFKNVTGLSPRAYMLEHTQNASDTAIPR